MYGVKDSTAPTRGKFGFDPRYMELVDRKVMREIPDNFFMGLCSKRKRFLIETQAVRFRAPLAPPFFKGV